MPNIPLQQAKEMIVLYVANKIAVLKTNYDPNILALSETFTRDDIDAILQQPNCVSFRIYYGMKADLNVHAILVGVDADGNDILSVDKPIIIEESTRCPPYCKLEAGLNS